LWFQPTKVGTYHLFCAEYCGTKHSGMIGSVIVQTPADYEAWLSGTDGQGGSMAERGQALFTQYACNTCHRSDAGARGPNLEGVFGKTVVLNGGATVKADENYIRDSIYNPQKKVVLGYQPIMPTFKGQLSEDQVMYLVAYIKTLGAKSSGSQAQASK
jgi:cytochrome c oxidase subunit 2